MRAGWRFDRGNSSDGRTAIRCTVQTQDDEGAARTFVEFTIDEQAARDMRTQLDAVLGET